MTHWLFDSWPSSLSVTLSQSTAGTWHIPPQLYPPSLSCRISRMSSWWLRPELFRKVMWNNHKQWTFIDIHKLKKHGKGSTQKENIHTHTHHITKRCFWKPLWKFPTQIPPDFLSEGPPELDLWWLEKMIKFESKHVVVRPKKHHSVADLATLLQMRHSTVARCLTLRNENNTS